MAAIPDGYTDADVEQQGLGGHAHASNVDPRSPFMHDRDRILYTSAFGALAGKTQVVSANELGGYHTRLTHSLKVAQVGRRMAEMLRAQNNGNGPDPDLVEAACLAHDIGHPPFGHAGEEALREVFEKHTHRAAPDLDGFEGNAQNLRILTYLSVRTRFEQSPGLHLTRATLDATTKYPWFRGDVSYPKRYRKFGVYREDQEVAKWIFGPRFDGELRPIEEQIMDWADDITYACHDLEDFHRAGAIPFNLLFRTQIVENSRITDIEQDEFFDYVKKKRQKAGIRFNEDSASERFFEMSNMNELASPYHGSASDKARLYSMTGRLIEYFLDGVKLKRVDGGTEQLVRYNATLEVPEEKRELCSLLKELIWYYVIDQPSLASQQAGQRRILKKLVTWHCDDPRRLLPQDRLDELAAHSNVVRAACDHISSMTERQALSLYQRMSGHNPGAITDRHS